MRKHTASDVIDVQFSSPQTAVPHKKNITYDPFFQNNVPETGANKDTELNLLCMAKRTTDVSALLMLKWLFDRPRHLYRKEICIEVYSS